MLKRWNHLSMTWKCGIAVCTLLCVVMSILHIILHFALQDHLEQAAIEMYGTTRGIIVGRRLAEKLEQLFQTISDASTIRQTFEHHVASIRQQYHLRSVYVVNEQREILMTILPKPSIQEASVANVVTQNVLCRSVSQFTKQQNGIAVDCVIPFHITEQTRGFLQIGIVDQAVSLSAWQSRITTHRYHIQRHFWFSSLLVIVFTTILLTSIFWWYIVRRIAVLAEITERMSFGWMEDHVDIQGQDELGQLEAMVEQTRLYFKRFIVRI